MNIYLHYRGPMRTLLYVAWWGRPGTPEYREVSFLSDGTDVDETAARLSLGPLGPAAMATGTRVA